MTGKTIKKKCQPTNTINSHLIISSASNSCGSIEAPQQQNCVNHGLNVHILHRSVLFNRYIFLAPSQHVFDRWYTEFIWLLVPIKSSARWAAHCTVLGSLAVCIPIHLFRIIIFQAWRPHVQLQLCTPEVGSEVIAGPAVTPPLGRGSESTYSASKIAFIFPISWGCLISRHCKSLAEWPGQIFVGDL